MSFVVFAVPTIGRPSLRAALESVVQQPDPDWRVLVAGDGFLPQIPLEHEAIEAIEAPATQSAGLTRNAILALTVGSADEWVAFLDDDDCLAPHYVAQLRMDGDVDCVVFRMHHPRLGVLPSYTAPNLAWGGVGISYAVRRAFLVKHELRFIREENPDDPAGAPGRPERARNEDVTFLQQILYRGGRVRISEYLGYLVGEAVRIECNRRGHELVGSACACGANHL